MIEQHISGLRVRVDKGLLVIRTADVTHESCGDSGASVSRSVQSLVHVSDGDLGLVEPLICVGLREPYLGSWELSITGMTGCVSWVKRVYKGE